MRGDTPAAAPGGAAASTSPILPATVFVVHYATCTVLPVVIAVSTSWEDATAAADAEVTARGGHCPGPWGAPVGPTRARSRAVVAGPFNDMLVLQEIAVDGEAGASPPTRIHLVTYKPGLHPGLPFAAAFSAEAARAAADRELAARGGTYTSDWTAADDSEIRDAARGHLWDRIVVTSFPFRGTGTHSGSAV